VILDWKGDFNMAKYIKYDINKIAKYIFNADSHTYNTKNFNELINELKQLMYDLGDICEQTDEEEIFWIIHKFLDE